MKIEPIGLYVHIPFCLKKCNYCDFCSFSTLEKQERDLYLSRLTEEILGYKRSDKIHVDTVFFGGGTPSLLEPSEFFKICDAVSDSFEILPDTEFTVEANPKTLNKDKLRAFTSRGVNRISLGMQSIHENELKMLGRIHNAIDFQNAYQLCQESGIQNINIDVMYGIPEQTASSFQKTLEYVTSIQPAHISAYGLILEEGTKFWDVRNSLPLPSEDAECDMYNLACRFLSSNGYSHYEISNYSKPGFESKHNLKYWRDKEYIGVGISAYSYFNDRRYGNSRSLAEYLSENPKQYVSEDFISKSESAYEFAMLAFRLGEGLLLSEYKNRYGTDFLIGREERINDYVKAGYMGRTDERIFLTEKGFYVSNTILTDLL
jgi:oxygen-independent coproporphyrinogen-3 oxidase